MNRKLATKFLVWFIIILVITIVLLIILAGDFKIIIDTIGIYMTAFLGLIVFVSQTKKDDFEYTRQRPLLNFINTSEGWVILNVGNGPALYIRFMGKNKVDWVQPVIGYAIPPNMALTIRTEINGNGDALAVYYKDLFRNEYIVQCEGDTNSEVKQKGSQGWDKKFVERITMNARRSNSLRLIKLDK
jgi:hypothetical protein